ncbi:DUF3558 domain-containing protein [Amycolatopsis carbonis]|uniref:DUF3558 domain-containing protein n=1 Tax=Amycolatopsis carbonis TaxID=715471 RepID=A0A9Y2IJQ2_9PSEU|nr:DUF3558 domain-containing protein [Amycolatopsis sp. 2-15]WIX80430.1 DUF3558 domain-containing protein [Amycolatopsis sp. 2-15]
MTTKRLLLTFTSAAATFAVVAGCSGGAVPPPASTSPSPVEALPHSGAPKVERPLPASVLSGDPCQEALTSDQLKEIFGTTTQGKRDDTSGLGPDCHWNNTNTGAAVDVNYVTQTRQGLSGVYQNTKPQVSLWKELSPIQGFPAAAHSSESPDSMHVFCQVSTGIRDDLSFDTSLTLSTANVGKVNPCDIAAQVADMVVTNLRQKAGA